MTTRFTVVYINLKKHYAIILIMLLEIALRLFLNQWDFYIDDPIITFRFTQNILAGSGFTFNPGERVLGTTAPLYALLLTIPTAFSIPVWISSRLLDLLADLTNILLIYAILRNLAKHPLMPTLGAFIYAISPFLNLYAMNGMETPLVIALMLSALYAAMRNKKVATGILSGLALISRIDTALFILLLFIGLWWQRKQIPLKEIIWSVLTFLPWFIFAMIYFGSPIPVTLHVKLVYYKNLINPVFALGTVVYVLGNSLPPLILYAFLAILGVICYFRQRLLVIILVWILFYIAINMFLSPNSHHWYYIPPVPFILILATLGWDLLVSKLSIIIKSKYLNTFISAAVVLVSVGFTVPVWTGEIVSYIHRLIVVTSNGKQISNWLAANVSRDAIFCTTNPGYPGMYTRFRILDTGCLVSPQLLPLYENHSWEEADRMAIQQYKPDLVFVIGEDKVNISPDYVTLKEFIATQKARNKDKNGNAIILGYKGSGIVQNLWHRKETGDPRFDAEMLIVR